MTQWVIHVEMNDQPAGCAHAYACALPPDPPRAPGGERLRSSRGQSGVPPGDARVGVGGGATREGTARGKLGGAGWHGRAAPDRQQAVGIWSCHPRKRGDSVPTSPVQRAKSSSIQGRGLVPRLIPCNAQSPNYPSRSRSSAWSGWGSRSTGGGPCSTRRVWDGRSTARRPRRWPRWRACSTRSGSRSQATTSARYSTGGASATWSHRPPHSEW
jgi:hypothetical protein